MRTALCSTILILLMMLGSPVVCPAQDQGQNQGDTADALPGATGGAGATDQVEAWIQQNLADMREAEAAEKPDVSTVEHPAVTGQPPASDEPGGSLDWASGALNFTTVEIVPAEALSPKRAMAMAKRKATLRARKALLSAVQNLPLDGRRTVGKALTQSEMAGVQAHLQNSRMRQREDMGPDGATQVFVSALADLRGDLGNLLMPGAEPFLATVSETIELTSGTLPTPQRDPEQAAYRTSMAELGGFTGLVVDARGLGAKPALLPVVADPSGLTAYGPFQVRREDAVAKGLAIYTHDPDGSLVRGRVGKSPLLVRALAASGTNLADLVISYEDAILVRTLFKNQDVKNHCRAVIILD